MKQTSSFVCVSREIIFFTDHIQRTQVCIAHYTVHVVRSATHWAAQAIRSHSLYQSGFVILSCWWISDGWVVWAHEGMGYTENTPLRVARVGRSFAVTRRLDSSASSSDLSAWGQQVISLLAPSDIPWICGSIQYCENEKQSVIVDYYIVANHINITDDLWNMVIHKEPRIKWYHLALTTIIVLISNINWQHEYLAYSRPDMASNVKMWSIMSRHLYNQHHTHVLDRARIMVPMLKLVNCSHVYV